MLTPSLVQDGSEASDSSLEDERDAFGEESGHVTSLSPVEFENVKYLTCCKSWDALLGHWEIFVRMIQRWDE